MSHNAKRLLLLGCTVAALLAIAPPAWAAEDHVLDPVLSLTGGTATSADDPTPDPGSSHPPTPFNVPCGTATDPHGDIYVSSCTKTPSGGGGKTIDVFDPQGNFLVRIPFPDAYPWPEQIAVDSEGNLYVKEGGPRSGGGSGFIDLYEPDSYPPTAATEYAIAKEFELTSPSFGPCGGLLTTLSGVSVDPSDGHLYIANSCRVEEYASAAEGSAPIDEEAAVSPGGGKEKIRSAAVYGANHDLYAATYELSEEGDVSDRVYVFDGADGHIKCELDGAPATGGGGMVPFDFFSAKIAVDQSNGDLYLYAGEGAGFSEGVVYQFSVSASGCGFIGRLPQPPNLKMANGDLGQIAVDAPIVAGEPGYDSPNAGYVYVTSGISNGHLFAYRPRTVGPPEIRAQAVSDVGETEAVLEAELNPNALATTYHFQYASQAAFDEHGYEGGATVPLGDQSAGHGAGFLAVSVPVEGLDPGAAYRFRLIASNCEDPEAEPGECLTEGEGSPGGEGEDASFSTYPASGGLPDGRAYELVTPPDTQGHIPTMIQLGGEAFGVGAFATPLASPDGASVLFGSNSGALPGIGGGGRTDVYEARRDPLAGWQSRFVGLSGSQSPVPRAGGASTDHRYEFWLANKTYGSLDLVLKVGGTSDVPTYLHTPDDSPTPSPNCGVAAEPLGRFEWVGCGSRGSDPAAAGRWISPGGEHVIFISEQQLEPCGPPSGKVGIYDRTPGGPTHCASLLPGDVTPSSSAGYKGVSADGRAVAFTVVGDPNLYVRRDDAETLIVAAGSPTFAGLSADGRRVFYLSGGDLFACDLDEGGCAGEGAHPPIPIGSGGESTLVNVSADGSHAYFFSPLVLTGSEENEFGAKAKAGEENLYAWDGSALRFIAIVDPLDVANKPEFGGLGQWVIGVLDTVPSTLNGPGSDPSRTTPDGRALIFQSSAQLTGYDNGGRTEIYRYEGGAEPGARLLCLSCNPTGAAAASDARLQSPFAGDTLTSSLPPLNMLDQIANLSADGQRVFFQSADPLVAADLDGRQDVYEWEAEGVGACTRPAGCLALISAGESAEDDYLYAMSADARDVFFLSADTLVPQDPDPTYSVYDAREGGGFAPPSPPAGECLGEACQPAVDAPADATPASAGYAGPGNPQPARGHGCPRGKRRVRAHGKTRCVKPHRKPHHRPRKSRAHHKGRAAR
jgi:hypothetical protein